MIWLLLFLLVGTAQAGGGAERIPRCLDLGDGQCSNIIIYRDGTAGEWIVDKDGYRLTKILADKDGNTILLECQDGVPCKYTASARHLFECHKKMQEAMRRLDDVMLKQNNTPGLFIIKNEDHKYWDTTMKECVERDR